MRGAFLFSCSCEKFLSTSTSCGGLLFSGFDFSFEAFYFVFAEVFIPFADAFDYLAEVVFEFIL